MYKKHLFIFLLCINCIVIISQNPRENSFRYVSSGNFPTSIVSEVQIRIDSLYEEQRNSRTSFRQKQKLDTLVFNEIYLKNLLVSGEVMYGDSISTYINKIAIELLKDSPDLKSKLHFFIVRSSEVDAYNFDSGYIFFTTGLIAQLENEAQFAFLLAHEIAHYSKKHPTVIDLKRELELFNRNQYSHIQMLEFLKIPYTLKEELEADVEAFEIIKNSNYSFSSIDEAFDLLQYKLLPFNDVKFDRSFFEYDELKFADTLILKKVTPISSFDENESNSGEIFDVHQRRGVLGSSYNVSDAGKKKYILPKQEFVSMREIARFSLCNDYLINRDYVNAIYASFILLKKYPKNDYLQSVVSKALYAISIYKTTKNRNPVPTYLGIADAFHPKSFENFIDLEYTTKQGNSQSLYYLFNQISSEELNVLSVAYVWKAYKKSRNVELKPIMDSLFSELFVANKLMAFSFSHHTREELIVIDSLSSLSVEKESSKYEKIKTLQTKNEINSLEYKLKFAFVNFFKDDEFSNIFEKNSKAYKRKLEREKALVDLSLKITPITKVVFVDPFFTYYPLKRENLKKEIERTAIQKKKYVDFINTEAAKQKLNYQIIDKNDTIGLSIEAYKDRAAIHSWIIEREKNGTNPDVLVLGTENMHKLAEKYGTPFFIFSGIKSIGEEMGPKTVHFFKVYNILSGELVYFDLKIANYVANAQEFSLGLKECLIDLSKRTTK